MIVNEYYLQAINDRCKSFYKKAKVFVFEDGRKVLRSYATDVAFIKCGELYVYDLYSNTTTRHIKEFATQNGFSFKNGRDLMKRYNADRYNYTSFENL